MRRIIFGVRLLLLCLCVSIVTSAIVNPPAPATPSRPAYARYIARPPCPNQPVRQASWDVTNCDYWTSFCASNNIFNVWEEHRDVVAHSLCIPGDPPYAFGMNSYGQCNPFTFNEVSVVPTLINDVGIVQVTIPCNYPYNTIITGVASPKLRVTPLPTLIASQYKWFLTVIQSSNGDFSPNYIAPADDGSGRFQTTSQRPPFETIQVISVVAQDTFTNFLSNPINITFVIKTCQLRITGPASFTVCNDFGAGAQIPEAVYKISPSPPGPAISTVSSTTVVWNDPDLVSSTNGDTNTYVEAQQGGTFQVPSTLTTTPSITEVQVYNFTAVDTAAGSNFIMASRLITVEKWNCFYYEHRPDG
ncbi:hypothetical protein RvY_15535 [Ramazzottius varieornatus]|uniref:Fibronectin type-III domain-containing protein n=1 Tax=Ramazzottius varieornatus TaxID=947166 RepID=A0A1D1W225_RAMVA|nr:hypothetical protein RvY_15535 [Ramazzottius varieornatus]